MDSITNELRRKYSHLTKYERGIIQSKLRAGCSLRGIAREIGCAVNTVRNEIKRGLTPICNGTRFRYYAEYGQAAYEYNRENCGRRCVASLKKAFLKYVYYNFKKNNWSLDACVGRALFTGKFSRDDIVCTKTLYNYVNKGLIVPILAIELPLLIRRKRIKKRVVHERKRIYGRSILERPDSVKERFEFGHWECDLVIGNRSDDNVLLTMVERKTRKSKIYRLPSKSSSYVMSVFYALKDKFGKNFNKVFKSITTDNGSEFSQLYQLEELEGTYVYYARPYCSGDKGTNENQNGLFRRFIKKHTSIRSYTDSKLAEVENWANQLPRRILSYRTAQESFDDELSNILNS